jgi:2-keto-4-pentenoate hydratase
MLLTPEDLLTLADRATLWPDGSNPVSPKDAAAVTTAYRVQLAVRDLRHARGERLRGYKIGFTNRTLWERYNVRAPIWGAVWDSTLRHCDGQGRLSLDGTCQPRIEPEVVFGMRATPAADATLDELFDAIDWIAPGFEIVQSHRPDWKFVASDCVSDGSLHARLLVGRTTDVRTLASDASALNELLATATVTLQRDGRIIEHGRGANVLDSPLNALLHFLRELRACPGATDLRAGDVVTTGTWTDAWPVTPGQDWSALFSLPALGSIKVGFDGARAA